MIQTNIIQNELSKEYNIVDKGTFEEKNPLYIKLLYSSPKEVKHFEFPIEIMKRSKPILKLPFRLGKLLWQTGEEIVR